MKYRNNPLNVRYAATNRWKGLLGVCNGFCTFYSLKYGFRAAWLILRSYRKRGIKSIHDIITTWAPPGENATYNYIKFVSDHMKLFPWDQINTEYDYVRLVYYMAWFEQGSLDELPPLRSLYDVKRESGVKVIV